MEFNEQQLNALLSLIDTKINTAVTTKLSSLIPDQNVQNMTAFEQIWMKGYTCGAPLQQGTFREFLRRCHLDNITILANNGITISFNQSTKTYTISGLSLQNSIADCTKTAFKSITNGTATINATSKHDGLSIIGTQNVKVTLNSSTKEIDIRLDLGDTLFGGSNKPALIPEYYPMFVDKLQTDKDYPLSLVKIETSLITDFSTLDASRYEFIIDATNAGANITNDLANAGVAIPQTSINFVAGKIYKLIIINAIDTDVSTVFYIAYYHELNQ